MTDREQQAPAGGEFAHGAMPMKAYTDPVCGMMVNPATAKGTLAYKGQTYYFCSSHCATRFDEAPERYLDRPESERPRSPAERRPSDPLPRVLHHDQLETPSTLRDPVCGILADPKDRETMQGCRGDTSYVCHPGEIPPRKPHAVAAADVTTEIEPPSPTGPREAGDVSSRKAPTDTVELGPPTLQDPVCGRIADPAKGAPSFTHQGHRFYFCDEACLRKFQEKPQFYLERQHPQQIRKRRFWHDFLGAKR